MYAPMMTHLKMVWRILWYVKVTIEMGLHFSSHTTLDLFAFSDADWTVCPTTRRSTTSYCTFLGGNLISWNNIQFHDQAQKQSTALWLTQQLNSLGWRSFSKTFKLEWRLLSYSTVTISVLFIWQLTLYSMLKVTHWVGLSFCEWMSCTRTAHHSTYLH